MTVWIDAQLSPALAGWLSQKFGLSVAHVRDLSLVGASDPQIFDAARAEGAVLLTKDRDFADLVKRRGSPPQVVWVTSGNTSNQEMKRILTATFQKALSLLESGEALVELKR